MIVQSKVREMVTNNVIVLDCTAGSRMLWPNSKDPPHVLFTDRNYEAVKPPDVFCDYTKLPFRDGAFKAIIFDPPHAARYTIHRGYHHQNPAAHSYYGWDIRPRDLIRGIINAGTEFSRLTDILCLKWSDIDYPDYKVLGWLHHGGWREVHRVYINKGAKSILSYWVTLKQEDPIKNEDEMEEGEESWGMLLPQRTRK